MTTSYRESRYGTDIVEIESPPNRLSRASGNETTGASPLPQLLSPEEVADYLGVNPYTVRERLKRGEIPGRKHGARWLIRVVDLVRYVEPNDVT